MKINNFFDIVLGVIMLLSGAVFFTHTLTLWELILTVIHTTFFYISLYLTENSFSFLNIEGGK
jgi:hypothetical protein